MTSARTIDLNADLGEGGAFDAELLALVSSANISCGAHAGEADDITSAIRLALLHDVKIGAHPSYPDRLNHGRVSQRLSVVQLQDTIRQQLTWLQDLVHSAGGELNHVKPHGALYNDAARDRHLATALAGIVHDFNKTLTLVGLAGSELVRASREAGLHTLEEAFVDRRYCSDGSLVPRTQPGSVIDDPQVAARQALDIIESGRIAAIDGSIVTVSAQTLCIHGDTPGAVAFAVTLRDALLRAGITVNDPAKPVNAPN
ncbi:MAG: 5-oxoprolinase subunit PxpA [Pseudohongiella sp.]|uniref:5-oxoprolinase subunit PxpA n=1 Tax=Pseudohongiella sp. TaxID=1979412 RepID=UPI0034A06454